MTITRLLLLAVAVAAVACTAPAVPVAAPSTPPATVRPTTTPVPTPALSITVTDAAYGRLVLSSRAGADCDVVINMVPGRLGDRPPERTTAAVGPSGVFVWSYATPPQPRQRAAYAIACRAGDERVIATAPFEITDREPRAAAFTARVIIADPPSDVRGDPALVPLRDTAAAQIRSALAREWSAATRGLGTLQVIEGPAEVLIKVVAARSSSVHERAGDGSQEIRVFVASPGGPESTENLVAIALHEIGHIWCCSGEGSEPGGHWATAAADPELQGVDRFGLMNHPVSCLTFGTVVSCPNRFSRRDLTAFGFTNIPSPPADPCLSQARPIEVRITALDATIAAKRAAIDAAESSLNAISTRLRAIEAQYGRTLPPGVYEEYNALVDRYNALLGPYRLELAAHNAAVDERNALILTRRTFPC